MDISLISLVFYLFSLNLKLISAKQLSCGFPGTPAYGYVKPDRAAYSEGEVVSFSCRVGYILLGSPISRCTGDGSWSEDVPICDDSMTTLGVAFSTPTVPGNPAELAIDRDKDTCAYLKPKKPRWWRIDLGEEHKVLSVAVTMISPDKYVRFTVFVIKIQGTSASYKRCASFTGKFGTETIVLTCAEGKGIEGQRVHIEDHLQEEGIFEICEVEVQVEKDTGYDCGRPSRNLYSITYEPKNDMVEYGCIRGYEIKGNDYRYCLSTGQWSGEPPICEPILCDDLEDLENGDIRITHDNDGPPLEGAVAIYKCDEGYRIEGSITRNCMKDGTWSGKDPQCKAIRCPVPDGKDQGGVYRLVNKTNSMGSMAMLRCKGGKREGDNPYIICTEDGEWTVPEAHCIIPARSAYESRESPRIENQGEKQFKCGFPGAPANGFVKPDRETYTEGEVVSYSCEEEYSLLGSDISKCEDDGSWSEDVPICDELIRPISVDGTRVRSKHPAHLAVDGDKSTCAYLSPNAVRRFKIDLGKEHKVLSVSVTLDSADKNLNISVSVIHFERSSPLFKKCGNYVGKLGSNHTIVFSCEDGKGIEGRKIHIEDNFNYDGVFKLCEVEIRVRKDSYKCGRPRQNLYSIIYQPEENIVDYGCIRGYEISGKDYRNCLSTGQWSGEPPICELIRCKELDHLENGYIEITHDNDGLPLEGAIATYRCNEGYTIEGPITRNCTVDGSWSGKESQCKAKPLRCGFPGTPANGFVKPDKDAYYKDETVSYSCEEAYILQGSLISSCGDDGSWSEDVPICDSVIRLSAKDSTPTASSNPVELVIDGNKDTCAYFTPFVVRWLKVDFKEKYKVLSVAVTMVASDGYANFTVFVANEDRNGRSFEICATHIGKLGNETIVFSCADGEGIEGNQIFIEDTNADQDYLKVCEVEVQVEKDHGCGRPSRRLNSITKEPKEDKVEYECNRGYIIKGLDHRYCFKTGQWSQDPPICEPIICDDLDDLENGDIILKQDNDGPPLEGAVAIYKCNEGYKIEGPILRNCMEDGSWSGKVPQCKAIPFICGFPGTPAYGYVKLDKDEYYEGESVSYSCRVGFILLGSNISQCTEEGFWSEDVPVCDDSMTMLGEVFSTETVSTNPAEFATDGNRDTCAYLVTNDAKWLRVDLKGQHNVLSVAVKLNSSYEYVSFTVFVINTERNINAYKRCASYTGKLGNESIFLSCNEGKGIEGHKVQIKDDIQINDRRFFDHKEEIFQICEIEVQVEKENGYDCGRPRRNLHSITKEPKDNLVEYGCISGYKIKGNDNRYCLSTGQWLGDLPICEPVLCDELDDIENGSIVIIHDNDGPPMEGAVANYTCNEGYEIEGPITRNCKEDGSWDGKVPKCKSIKQHEIPIAQNSFRIGLAKL